LDFAGYKVAREFYINDTGNQIDMLGNAILWRLFEAQGVPFRQETRPDEDGQPPVWLLCEVDGRKYEFLEKNLYKGDYIKDLVRELQAQGGPIDLDRAKRFGKDRLLDEIRKDLETFRVRYDTWTSEESLHRSGKVDEVLNFFNSWGLTFTKDGATYLKTTDHGAVEDKPIVKADGQFVYRLPDMAYH